MVVDWKRWTFFFFRSLPKSVKYYVAFSWCWSCNFQFRVYFVCSHDKIRVLYVIYKYIQTYLQVYLKINEKKLFHFWDLRLRLLRVCVMWSYNLVHNIFLTFSGWFKSNNLSLLVEYLVCEHLDATYTQ